MSSPDETIAIEPPFSEQESEKVQAADVEALAQSVDNPFVDLAHIEKAARSKINNQAELYRSLVRALKRRRGFGILFLQCTPAKGKEIFSRLQTDLSQKRIGRLTLSEPIENLKALVESREDLDELNVLFVEGIEHSLSPYIKSEIGRNDYYKLEVLPPILDHLNLHRENFRNQYRHLCFVFVVPPFALKYFMYRAVDFFSWHSGIWTFSPPEKELANETARALEGEFSEYSALSDEERNRKLVQLQDLIEVKTQPDEQRANLLWEQGLIFAAAQSWNAALRCFDEVNLIRGGDEGTQLLRGIILRGLGRNEEATAAYEAALSIKSDNHAAFYIKGAALSALGRNEEAVAAYDAALAIEPDDHAAFYIKGAALLALGRNEEAVAAYDAALAIKPDNHLAFAVKGNVLSDLGRKEEAIAAYDAALSIKPDNHEAFYNKGNVLSDLGRKEEAIAAYDAALLIKPDYHEAFYNKGNALSGLGREEQAINAYNASLSIKTNKHEAFNGKGSALLALGRNEEAIAAYDAALAIEPNNPSTHYNKACSYALSLQLNDALAFLQKAIALDNTNKYIEMAKTDSDFDAIRDRPQFQALIAQYEQKQHPEERSL